MSETNYKGLSICITTRDSREKLKKCLSAARNAFPEADIAVLDTGSTDGSPEEARSFTGNISSFNWCDDFSKAKNACIEIAKNDLVLIIDTDEYLEEKGASLKEILSAFQKYPDAVGRIKRLNSYINEQGYETEYSEWINRLFDRRLFHYEGRIHEQVTRIGADKNTDYRTYRTELSIFHDGYDLSPEERRKKAERNASLILKEMGENEEDPYLYYQLGKTCYAAGEKERAAESLDKALLLKPDPGMEYISDLLILLGYSLLETGKAEDAYRALLPYEKQERYGLDADFRFLYSLILMNVGRFQDAKDSFISCTDLKPSRTKGTSSFLAWYNAGVISEVTGDIKSARTCYERAGKFEKALEALKRCSG